MRINTLLLTFVTLFLFCGQSFADARLDKKLGLSVAQAKQVQTIQKEYRRKFSAKRQQLHRETRKLRRARIANDSAVMAQQQSITAKLQTELAQVRASENEQIRRLLTPQQKIQFEAIIAQRRASVGSSRNTKDF